ncbi:MAG: DUF6441 family protein [Actinomycetota bacterium]
MITIDVRSNIAQLQAQIAAEKRRMERAVKAGMAKAKEPLRAAVQAETKNVFKVKQPSFLRTWTVSANTVPGTIIIRNKAKGFSLHALGGSIGPRKGSALLIPINTAGGSRIGQKKLYKLLSWLRERNMTLFKNGILYVKPPMNTSRRGGVAIGTRVQKGFRRRLSGTFERPSGFDIKLNAQGLTAIAVVKRSITMRKRFDMDRLARNTLVPIVISSIAAELARSK